MFDWIDLGNPVALWWIGLSIAGCLNIALWVWMYRTRDRAASSAVLWLSFIYVAVCAFRSFLPRADVQRITLFDTWLSSVFVGRTVATVGELAFIAQWAVLLIFIGRRLESRWTATVGYVIFPLIFVAEICSWYGVITTHYLGNVIEESLWATSFAAVASAIALLATRARGSARIICAIAAIGCALYFTFMITVDMPMYWGRLQQ
ncbi:MAG: hypothetical protein AAB250_13060, partial [Bdellovibrionota bacterium]